MSAAVDTTARPRYAIGDLVRGARLGAAGWVGVALLSVFAAAVVFAPLIAPFDPSERVDVPYLPPGDGFLLGTDDVGRDLFSQLVYGSRTSLAIGFGVATLALLIGATTGSVAGLSGRWIDALLMRITDVVLTLPFLPLLIVVASFIGRGVLTQIVLIAILTWARPARLVRAAVLGARSRGHVEVAEGMGARLSRVLLRHTSYAVAPLLIPTFTRAAMGAILLEASLSFLGLGNPQSASWGTMLYWANIRGAFLTDAWAWWVLPPGLAIATLVVSLGLIGIGLEERLNPELRGGA